MKFIGIVKTNEFGKVVIPKILRRTMGIAVKDPLEIYFNGGKIILSKYEPLCIFCSQADEVKYIKDKTVCVHCINELKNIKNTPAGV